MTWWAWVLVGLAIWVIIGFTVAWLFGHFARVGSGE